MAKHLTKMCYMNFADKDLVNDAVNSDNIDYICQQLWAEIHILKTYRVNWDYITLVKQNAK